MAQDAKGGSVSESAAIGRFLCRIGLHRWENKDAVDWDNERATPLCIVTTYAWCKRGACNHPTLVIGREWVSFDRSIRIANGSLDAERAEREGDDGDE